MTKRVKRKIRVRNFLKFLCILLIIFLIGYILFTSKINNIVITGNKYLTDDEVLETAGLKDYPSFFFTFDEEIKSKLKKNSFVKSVKISRSFFNNIHITIKEYEVVLKYNNEYYLENGVKVKDEDELRVPTLINEVPEKKLKDLCTSLSGVRSDILGKISEIEYTPNTYDDGRFLLYMNDSNSVYLTLTKFEKINYYDDVLAQLEGKKGFLYLDSGNHFKIME